MKATLEFNLPEESIEHERAVKAADAFSALYKISEIIREYHEDGLNTIARSYCDAMQAEFRNIIEKCGIDLERLWA